MRRQRQQSKERFPTTDQPITFQLFIKSEQPQN